MADPLNVDTSLDDGADSSAAPLLAPNTGLGINAQSEDPFGDLALPEVSQADFNSILQSSDTPLTFSNHFQAAAAGGVRNQAAAFAKQFLGTPYVWGGTSPQGFDCSGLVQYVWKKFGVVLPRISQQQASAGTRVAIGDLKPMDLVLFNEGGADGPGHVAFWLGNGQILEAPHTGAQVRIRKLGKGENVFGVHLNIPN